MREVESSAMRARHRLPVPVVSACCLSVVWFAGCNQELVKEASGPPPTVTFETEEPQTASDPEIPPLLRRDARRKNILPLRNHVTHIDRRLLLAINFCDLLCR